MSNNTVLAALRRMGYAKEEHDPTTTERKRMTATFSHLRPTRMPAHAGTIFLDALSVRACCRTGFMASHGTITDSMPLLKSTCSVTVAFA